jgi:multidrug efflux pump subunit AcrA (membrane-fusion protein)
MRTQRWRIGWMAVASVLTLIVVLWVVLPERRVKPEPRDLSAGATIARLAGPRLVSVTPGSAFEKKLSIAAVKADRVSYALVTVTASVVAHFIAGKASPQDRWQFQSGDLSNAYADWRRAQNEAEFAGKQLEKSRELAAAQVARYSEAYERLKKLVDTGTETARDLATARADLAQAQIQTQKDVFDAESALNLALRNRAAAERILSQAGIDPRALEGTQEVAIVVADVPEARLDVVSEGAHCDARFYGIPDRVFRGRVTRVAPVLSPEKRTLRVLFELSDPATQIKPGMFADVGLGTDARDAVLVPAEAVLHYGRADYVFVRGEPGPWRVQEVELGETHGQDVEVRRGVAAGEQVIGSGAILLKPFLVRSVEG